MPSDGLCRLVQAATLPGIAIVRLPFTLMILLKMELIVPLAPCAHQLNASELTGRAVTRSAGQYQWRLSWSFLILSLRALLSALLLLATCSSHFREHQWGDLDRLERKHQRDLFVYFTALYKSARALCVQLSGSTAKHHLVPRRPFQEWAYPALDLLSDSSNESFKVWVVRVSWGDRPRCPPESYIPKSWEVISHREAMSRYPDLMEKFTAANKVPVGPPRDKIENIVKLVLEETDEHDQVSSAPRTLLLFPPPDGANRGHLV